MSDDPRGNLDAYRKKRDPDRTPEPFGGRPVSGGRLFVVHKHAARNLHYDLRLELDGVLKSWAVPKGPSVHAEEKRLAVHVEDHPLEYGAFEGVIPPGNYGAGSVIVWDRGTYGSFKPEDLMEQYRRGKMELELNGFKLRGRWTLVRTRSEKDWLLLKKAGAGAAEKELIDRYPESVITGLTVEENADVAGTRAAVRAAAEALGAPRRAVRAKDVKPMLATLESQAFDDPAWLFEIKYDGVRVIAERDGAAITLLARSGADVTKRYPEVAEALAALPFDSFVVDGEIVAPDASGQPSFQRLQARMGLTNPHDVARARLQVPAVAILFDCLALDGHDLRKAPLIERKRCLERIAPPLGTVRYGDHAMGHGVAFHEAASAMRLEGIVAKRAASPYVGARSRDWIKIKCQRRQEFVIGGWTEPQGSRGHFGALLVGLYEGERFVYVTRVGTGFDDVLQRQILAALAPLEREKSPFDDKAPKGREFHWAEPKLVCEVRFTEWTDGGGLRHPTFVGMRDDKEPRDCRREEPLALSADAAPAAEPTVAVVPVREEKREVRLSNLHKVFWPAEGYTKGDLVAYYDAIAPQILPYLRDRPIFVTRYPDGIDGKSFYQKDAPEFAPSWVRTETIHSGGEEREIRYFVVDDAETLRYIANSAVIPIHPWSSRMGSLERPDWMILDLDPKDAPFADVIRIAKLLHSILDDLELPNFIKTSGASGLHVLVPLGARYTYEQSRTFARLLATIVVQEAPEISTIVRQISGRGGKVYVDYGQNGYGQSIVSPFCVRPLPGAPVSCPLEWSEVNAKLDPKKHTIKTVPKRFEKMADPLLPILGPGIDMAAALPSIEARLKRGA